MTATRGWKINNRHVLTADKECVCVCVCNLRAWALRNEPNLPYSLYFEDTARAGTVTLTSTMW